MFLFEFIILLYFKMLISFKIALMRIDIKTFELFFNYFFKEKFIVYLLYILKSCMFFL